MRKIILGFFLLLLLNLVYAHEIETGDPIHDANLQHDDTPTPSVNQKDVSSWENAAPFVVGLFVVLAVFAFAIGLFLNPQKGTKRR